MGGFDKIFLLVSIMRLLDTFFKNKKLRDGFLFFL
jgi:hypothetical protein